MTFTRRSLFHPSKTSSSNSSSSSRVLRSKPKNPKSKLKSSSSSKSSSTIQTIFQKLPLEYKSQIPPTTHNELITSAHETLRLLHSKTTRGQKICKGDSNETRSVIVLEHILRCGIELNDGTMSTSVRVPLDVMGKFVGIGKKDVERLGKAVGLYLDQMDVGARRKNNGMKNDVRKVGSKTAVLSRTSTGNGVGGRGISGLGKRFRNVHQRNAAMLLQRNRSKHNPANSANRTNTNTSTINTNANTIRRASNGRIITQTLQPIELIASKSQHIHLLCIKLQACLHDPNTIEQKARSLWWNLIQYKLRKDHLRRNAILFDLQLKVKQYEGACFYVTVYDLEQGSLAAPSTASSTLLVKKKKVEKNGGKKRKKSNTAREESYDYENGGDVEDVDGDEMYEPEHVLTLDDIVHELRMDEVSFASILDEVSKLAREMGSNKYNVTKSQLLARKRSQSQLTKSDNKDENEEDDRDDSNNNNHTSKKARIQGMDSDRISFESDEEDDELDYLPRNGKPNYIAETKFLEWKDKELQSILPGFPAAATNHNGSYEMLTRHQFYEMKKHATQLLQR